MRHLFISESPTVLKAPTAGGDMTAILYPGAPVTIWTDPFAGSNVTSQLTAPDGTSAVIMIANGIGELPSFRGPDGAEVLFIDAGGDLRTPIRAVDLQPTDPLTQRVTNLENSAGQGGGGGGSLPAGTTLEQIPNGATRLALTQTERNKLAAYPDTPLTVGTAANQAKPGNYTPRPIDIGAVQNVTGFGRVWGRTSADGLPSAAEGAQDGDWCFMDAS